MMQAEALLLLHHTQNFSPFKFTGKSYVLRLNRGLIAVMSSSGAFTSCIAHLNF